MQKHLTLKALIAVACMSAFAAQAGTVDVYGNVDAGYARVKDGAGVKYDIIGSGVKDPSFIGFKGSEDLGNGLKAEYVLESGFNVNNGGLEQDNTLFSRNAYVGLSGAFGTVKIGKISSFSRDIVKQYDAFGGELWGAAGAYEQFSKSADFQRSTIAYTKQIGALSFGMSHQVAGVPDGGLTDGSVTAFSAGYQQGAIGVGIVYTQDKSSLLGTSKSTQIGGSIDTRIGKAYALYENGKDPVFTTDVKDAYSIGFKAPVSGAGALLVSTGEKKQADGTKHSLFAVGGEYNLSKRTSLYTSFSKDDVKDAGDLQVFTAGVAHKF
jgi:predicted porin